MTSMLARLRNLFNMILVVTCASASAVAAPQVSVRFVVAAPTFAQNLGAVKSQVERDVATALASDVTAYFPVVLWDASAPAQAAAELRLTLTEIPASPLPAISLVWSAIVGGQAVSTADLPPIALYGSFDLERATHDPANLASIIQQKLAAWLQNQDDRERLKGLLKLIPLAHSVEVDSQAEHILVPLSLAQSKMDSSSILLVTFDVSNAGNTLRGKLKMSGLLETRSGVTVRTCGTVNAFEYPQALGSNGWSPLIPQLLAAPSVASVFIDEYVRSDFDTVNGNFVNP